jgi:hypothetical protein
MPSQTIQRSVCREAGREHCILVALMSVVCVSATIYSSLYIPFMVIWGALTDVCHFLGPCVLDHSHLWKVLIIQIIGAPWHMARTWLWLWMILDSYLTRKVYYGITFILTYEFCTIWHIAHTVWSRSRLSCDYNVSFQEKYNWIWEGYTLALLSYRHMSSTQSDI